METFYSDRWYNIFEIYDRDDDQFKGWYCNIGKPAMIEDDFVSYVDLAWICGFQQMESKLFWMKMNWKSLNLDDESRQKVYDWFERIARRFVKTKNPPS